MKRVELSVLYGDDLSLRDALLWNNYRKFIIKNYATLLAGEFDSIYKGKKERAACLTLRLSKNESVGNCFLRKILDTNVKATKILHTAPKDESLSLACILVLNGVIREHEKTVENAKLAREVKNILESKQALKIEKRPEANKTELVAKEGQESRLSQESGKNITKNPQITQETHKTKGTKASTQNTQNIVEDNGNDFENEYGDYDDEDDCDEDEHLSRRNWLCTWT